MTNLAIFGTPINPRAAVEAQLAGRSFCVSFYNRSRLGPQLDQVIRLVGEDGMLLIDNGAFSYWRANGQQAPADWWDAYYHWAWEIMSRCPQAVAIVPDVIDGAVEDNRQLLVDGYCVLPDDRAMAVWHLGDDIDYLVDILEMGFRYVAFGSSGEFHQPGTAPWHRRVAEAFAVVDATCGGGSGYARPWLHLLRAQSFHHLYPFQSSDSTNLAVNHSRHRHIPGHLKEMANGVQRRIDRSHHLAKDLASPADSAYQCRTERAALDWVMSAPAAMSGIEGLDEAPVVVRRIARQPVEHVYDATLPAAGGGQTDLFTETHYG